MDTRITKEEMDEWDREHGFAVDADVDEDLDDEPDDGSRYDDLLIYDSKPFDPLEVITEEVNGEVRRRLAMETGLPSVLDEVQSGDNIFRCLSANHWLEEAAYYPDHRPLFGPLWNEGELCILFADTGVGKSVLAMQIADAVSRGISVKPLENEAGQQSVLYLDFELSTKQFERRYTRFKNGKDRFHPSLLRAEISTSHTLPSRYKDNNEYIRESILEIIRESEARVVIIDNITWLNRSTFGGSTALELMKHLQTIKKELGLSILVLAHTPKRYSAAPLTINDLQGSKMLSNFADNLFAIGSSCIAPDLRYLKHIKVRNTGARFGAENVILYRLGMVDDFLQFSFEGYAREAHHLRDRHDTSAERKLLVKKAGDLQKAGKTLAEIAEILAISKASAGRYARQAELMEESPIAEART